MGGGNFKGTLEKDALRYLSPMHIAPPDTEIFSFCDT
jgi:hypothetical protein